MGEIPFMMQILGTRGVFAFFELEEDVHPMVDPVKNGSAVE